MRVCVRDGKVNGRPIVRAWESLNGWLWLAVERISRGFYFGLVISDSPEWGYFYEKDISGFFPFVWEVEPHDIPFIHREVRT